MKKTTAAWNRLHDALAGLEKAGDGRVARMNHRKTTLTALRQLRAAIDEEYPVVRKKVRRRKTALSMSEWRARMAKKGWVGVSPVHVPFLSKCNLPFEERKHEVFGPKWVVMMIIEGGLAPSKVAKIKKSRQEQRALNALYVATQK